MRIAVMGDTLCRAKDGGDPFSFVRPLWGKADVRLLNLEAVLSNQGTPAPKRTRLRTDPANVAYLAGVDVVHLANNHTLDYGAVGCVDTLEALHRQGIRSAGVGCGATPWTPVFVGGIAVLAFHAYPLSDGRYCMAHLEDERALRTVRDLVDYVETVVVSLHWGTEHAPHPSPAQIQQARAFIDAGAALVVGHGPHRLQPIERYKDGLIAYSLGNFNLWHTDVRERGYNRQTAILFADLDGRRVTGYDLHPLAISDNGCPVPLAQYLEHAHRPEMTQAEWYKEIGGRYVVDSLRSLLWTIPRYGWPRVRKLVWWLRQRHTWRAIKGMLQCV